MNTNFECESTLTDRYQTTVPEPVRRVLKLGKRDKIHYSILPDASVLITRANAESEADDPILGQFLDFLVRDISTHPESVRTVDADLMARAQGLVGHIEIDLDAELAEDGDTP